MMCDGAVGERAGQARSRPRCCPGLRPPTQAVGAGGFTATGGLENGPRAAKLSRGNGTDGWGGCSSGARGPSPWVHARAGPPAMRAWLAHAWGWGVGGWGRSAAGPPGRRPLSSRQAQRVDPEPRRWIEDWSCWVLAPQSGKGHTCVRGHERSHGGHLRGGRPQAASGRAGWGGLKVLRADSESSGLRAGQS
jgi:hypothetical protein